MTPEELLRRLRDPEDNFVERKAGLMREEVRQVAVAFANSLPGERTAVLYIGVKDDLEVKGVARDDLDRYMQQIRRICEDDCFPAVTIAQIEALQVSGQHVIAAVFRASSSRPHFTGHAFVRVGSENVKASPKALDDLIASKNTKAGRLLQDKGKVVSVESDVSRQWQDLSSPLVFSIECVVEDCDAHVLKLRSLASGVYFDESLEAVEIRYDNSKYRTLLRLPFRGYLKDAWISRSR